MKKLQKSQYDVMLEIVSAPLTGTNWPYPDIKEKHRKYLKDPVFYVDDEKTGLTKARFRNLLKAIKFMDKFGGVLRPWQPSDEQMDEFQAKEREYKHIVFTSPHLPLTHRDKKKKKQK